MPKRSVNAALFFILLAVEICIALFVRDRFVRPYLGDVLVVVLLYFFFRIFIPQGFPFLPAAVFLFAALTEVLQYVRVVEWLGLLESRFFSTLIGTTFDWKDIVCYAAGCLLTGVYEYGMRKRKRRSGVKN